MSKHPNHLCQHRSKSGHHCHLHLAQDHPTLCLYHLTQATEQSQKLARAARRAADPVRLDDSADLSALLNQPLSTPKSPADLHAHLWNLSLALQQGRISPRRAAVLAYISSLLLRSLSLMPQSRNAANPQLPANRSLWRGNAPRPASDDEDPDGVPIVKVSIPRPIRNRPPAPSPLPTTPPSTPLGANASPTLAPPPSSAAPPPSSTSASPLPVPPAISFQPSPCYSVSDIAIHASKEYRHGMDHPNARRNRPQLRNQLLRQRRALVVRRRLPSRQAYSRKLHPEYSRTPLPALVRRGGHSARPSPRVRSFRCAPRAVSKMLLCLCALKS